MWFVVVCIPGIPGLGCMGVAYKDMMDALSTFGLLVVGTTVVKKRN